MCCSNQYLSRASSYRYSTIHHIHRDLSSVTAQIPCTLSFIHHTDTVLIGLTVPSCSQIPCCLVVLLLSNCSLLHTVTVLSGCIDHKPCSLLLTDTVLSGCIDTNCHSTQIPSCLFVCSLLPIVSALRYSVACLLICSRHHTDTVVIDSIVPDTEDFDQLFDYCLTTATQTLC